MPSRPLRGCGRPGAAATSRRSALRVQVPDLTSGVTRLRRTGCARAALGAETTGLTDFRREQPHTEDNARGNSDREGACRQGGRRTDSGHQWLSSASAERCREKRARFRRIVTRNSEKLSGLSRRSDPRPQRSDPGVGNDALGPSDRTAGARHRVEHCDPQTRDGPHRRTALEAVRGGIESTDLHLAGSSDLAST